MLPIAILAGGFGTRLGEITSNYPKCLLPINGKAFIDWQIDALIAAGYSDFVLCVSFKSELVKKHFSDGKKLGVRIEYSYDGKEQQGTGGAIRNALPLLGSEFAVIYGDSFLQLDYGEVEKSFVRSNAMATMTVFANGNQYDKSNVEFTGGKILAYNKFTPTNNMHHIDYGLTYFRREVFLEDRFEAPFDLSTLCQELAASGKLSGFEVYSRFYEIGSVRGIKEFSDYLGKVNQ
jgi:MurNAc alpha-1-phosphate uridylyltransferase